MARFIPLNRTLILGKLFEAEKQTLEAVGQEIETRARQKAPVRKLYKEKRKRSRAASPDTVAAAIRFVQNDKKISQRQRTEALYLLQRHPEEARTAIQRRGSMNRRRAVLLGKNKNISLKSHTGLFKGDIIATERVFKTSNPMGTLTRPIAAQRGTKVRRGFEPGSRLNSQIRSRGRYELRSGRAFTNEAGELIKPGRESKADKVFYGGHLKASILAGQVERPKNDMKRIQVSATANYALYVEFPTRHNRAQPFLLPAMKEAKESLGRTLNYELKARGLKRG